MGGFLGSILGWLLGFFFKRTPPPSRVEVQADRAATAETKLAQQSEDARVNAAVAKAVTNAPKDVKGTAAKLRKGQF